jgi:hypothetical protein
MSHSFEDRSFSPATGVGDAVRTPSLLSSQRGLLAGLLISTLLLAACAISPPLSGAANGQGDAFNGAIADLNDYILPTPEPTTEPELTVIVDTGGARANIRSGPGTEFPIVGKANSNQALKVLSRSEDNGWWQICCISTDAAGNATPASQNGEDTSGWIANSVVRPSGEGDAVAVSRPVFGPDLSADWSVDWKCGSERCEVKSCSADVQAKVSRPANQQLLPIEHQVVWDDACFDTDSWVFDVNQFTGQENTGEYKDNFLYSYWLGHNPGVANGVYQLDDGKAAEVYCSGPHQVEVEEGGGWTTVYEGNTCHDMRTGMLVYLSYNKRWLFTGEFEGETYNRAYFGDFETLEQKLVKTNAELAFVEPKKR